MRRVNISHAICRLLSYIIDISRTLSGSAYEISKRFKNLAITRRPKWAELFSYWIRNSSVRCRTDVVYTVAYFRVFSCVFVVLKQLPSHCGFTTGYVRLAAIYYDLYAEIWRIHYDISTSIFDNCTTMCEFSSSLVRVRARSAESPINRNGVAVNIHFQHLISSAIHTRNNNLVNFLWIYINLLNNHCSPEENQSVFVCQGPAHQPVISQLHSRGRNTYELVWNSHYVVQSRTNVVLYRTKSYWCRTNVVIYCSIS